MSQTRNRLPIIGITMGDPAGNGPELSLKALMHADLVCTLPSDYHR